MLTAVIPMGNIGLSELLVIFVIALLVIGPKRLPEVARGLGEAFRAFQDALKPVQFPERRPSSEAGEREPDRSAAASAEPPDPHRTG